MRICELIVSAVSAAPIDLRRDLLQNIVVGGGRWGGWANLAQRLETRLAECLRAHYGPGAYRLPRIKVIKPPEAGASIWMGGSILASIMRSRVPYITADTWRATVEARRRRKGQAAKETTAADAGAPDGDCPPHLLRQDSAPLFASERAHAWDAALLPAAKEAWEVAARERARELVSAAPSLSAALPPELCDLVVDALAQHVMQPCDLRAAAYLPPAEEGIPASADDATLASALRDQLSLDGAVSEAEEAEYAARRLAAYAPCVEELKRWIDQHGHRFAHVEMRS